MIPVLSPIEIEKMRQTGSLAAELLNYLGGLVKPGISTLELNNAAEEWTRSKGATSGPLGYKGFPRSICTSINEVVCHGIPSKRVLKEGDIINIDVSPVLNGYYGDTSRTFCVGKVSQEAAGLVEITEKCLHLGIGAVRPGAHTGDIGSVIQAEAEKHGYSVVKEFTGHGIGRVFHGDPVIFHYGEVGTGVELLPGMAFTIEPMLNLGTDKVRILPDQWTAITADNKLSAQCEHTILVVEDGVEILTK